MQDVDRGPVDLDLEEPVLGRLHDGQPPVLQVDRDLLRIVGADQEVHVMERFR
jgi:hypothetical protein